jgi:hypothetical protein
MRTENRGTLVGVFERREDADRAVEELRRAGIRDEDIGFAVRGEDTTPVTEEAPGTAAGEGAATGMLTGGVLGGLVGAAASGLIPGFGPVIAAGILSTILGGAAVGAAAGGMLGALMGLGIPEEEARYYQSEFEAGRVIITVKASDRWDEADRTLRSHGAYDVHKGPPVELGSPARRSYDGDLSMGDSLTNRASETHSWDDVAPTYRDAWERRHGMSGRRWQDEESGFHFGYDMAHDPRFADRDWAQAEADLRIEYDDWAARHGYWSNDEDAWSHVRENARATWESVHEPAKA